MDYPRILPFSTVSSPDVFLSVHMSLTLGRPYFFCCSELFLVTSQSAEWSIILFFPFGVPDAGCGFERRGWAFRRGENLFEPTFLLRRLFTCSVGEGAAGFPWAIPSLTHAATGEAALQQHQAPLKLHDMTKAPRASHISHNRTNHTPHKPPWVRILFLSAPLETTAAELSENCAGGASPFLSEERVLAPSLRGL